MTSDEDESSGALAQNLDALANRNNPPSKAALIRRYLPRIEAAQAAGATNAEIVAAFRAAGTEMSLSTFQSTLSRVRAKLGKGRRGERVASADRMEELGREDAGAVKTAAAAPQRRTRTGLQLPDPPPKFHWDPLEQPKISFSEDDDEKED